MINRILPLLFALLLSACASHTPLPAQTPALVAELPLTLQVTRQQNAHQQTWLLVLQREHDHLRCTLLDPLGIPLARQLLVAGQWQRDGLLPPNEEARELFAAVLFALTTDAALPAYPAGSWQQPATGQRQLQPDWQLNYHGPLDVELARPGLSYRIQELNMQDEPL